jgi:hypothetical protein
MADLDLDIHNYSLIDLENFLKLKKKYSLDDIENNEYTIREQLLSSGLVKGRFKADLIQFLEKAREMLFQNHPEYQERKPPTEIPKDWRMDSSKFPATKVIPPSREQNLIQHPNAQFVYSQPSNVFSGHLNPLDTRITNTYLTIDSRFRDNFYISNASDFTVQLPTKMNKVVSMQLSAIDMPMAFYGVSASYGNNYLYIYASQQFAEGDPITDYDIMITIPDGNYTSQDLIDTINELLCPKDESGNMTDPDSVFSYVHLKLNITESGSGTGKVVIEPVSNTLIGNSINCLGLDFTRDINGLPDNIDISTKIGWTLGFTHKKYEGCSCYVADAMINPIPLKYMYLSIEDYQKSVNRLFLSAFHQTNLNDNILARISLKTGSFTTMVENDFNLLTEPRSYFGPVDIQRLRIRLYDDHGRILNLNNSNYSFVLLFKMVYDL